MDFLFLLSLPCVQMVGISMRLAPYWTDLNKSACKRLFLGYGIIFFAELALLMNLSLDRMNTDVLNTYKMILNLGGISTFLVDCLVLKNGFFARLFILAMQGTLVFSLHSIPAFLIGLYFGEQVTLPLLALQSYGTTVLFLLLAWPLYKIFKQPLIAFRSLSDNEYHWHILWLTPALLYCAVFILTLNPGWLGIRGFIARLMAASSTYVIFRCITLDYSRLQQLAQMEHDNRLLLSQARAMEENQNTFRESEERLNRFRHDFRHQLRTLSTLLESGAIQEMKNSLASLDASLIEIQPLRFCDNNILNATISYYMADARRKGIECNVTTDFSNKLHIDALYLSVVIANGLENAIHALAGQKEKNLILRSRCAKGMVAVDMRNRFDGVVYFDKDDLPISRREGHGVGTRSIMAFTNQHHGTCSFSLENGWFVLRIIVEDKAL